MIEIVSCVISVCVVFLVGIIATGEAFIALALFLTVVNTSVWTYQHNQETVEHDAAPPAD